MSEINDFLITVFEDNSGVPGDLFFQEDILNFNIDHTIFNETDKNSSSVRMGIDYGLISEMQLFYNLTTPKF